MGKGLPKRLVDELVTRWKLEKLRQVVLEGDTDFRFMRLGVRAETCPEALKHLDHIPIDAIQVSDDVLNKFGLTQGNKQRVIAVGRLVEQQGCEDAFRCIVDADLDRVCSVTYASQSVLYTDYACMESYMWHPEVLQHALNLFRCEDKIKSTADLSALYDSISSVCKSLSAFKLINEENPHWRLSLHRSDASLSIEGPAVSIDLGTYLTQCKPRKEHREQIQVALQSAISRLDQFSSLEVLNGHDLIWILSYAIKSFTAGPKRVVEEDQVLQALICFSAGREHLFSEPMYKALEAWAS